MSDILKVPVTVITGFLGSGKTTLISQLMRNPNGKRLAVIVNEFGDVGVVIIFRLETLTRMGLKRFLQ